MVGIQVRFLHKYNKYVSNPLSDKGTAFLTKIRSIGDADRILSYYTRQQVLFLDWKLGATFWFIQVVMFIVIVGYVMIYKEGYFEFEQARGAVVTHVAGDAVASSIGKPATRYFSAEELTYPGLENGNVFVATRQTVRREMPGFCEDPEMPCIADSDCIYLGNKTGTCQDNGLCNVYGWCSVEDTPEIYEMNVAEVQIWARSFIQFVKIAPDKIFSTDYNESEPNLDNVFTLRQLLRLVEPVPINYEEVAQLGAVFEVSLRWDCKVQRREGCTPEVSVRRLDALLDPDDIGYSFKYSEYLDDDHRVSNSVSGLRLYFRTNGVGKKISMTEITTNVSTTGGLLGLAVVVADLLLTKVFKNRQKYIARKYEKTPDFSEYLAEVKATRKQTASLIDIEKAESEVTSREEKWMRRFEEEEVIKHKR